MGHSVDVTSKGSHDYLLEMQAGLWHVLTAPVKATCLSVDYPNKKRKRSRWNQDAMDQKTVIPGMPTVIPPGLTREQERAYIGK